MKYGPGVFKKDERFYAAIKDIELKPAKSSDNYFHYLLRAIAFQQLSTKAGTTIHGRFLDLFEENNPTPEKVLELEMEQLRAAGLSGRKSEYMKNIAEFWIRHRLENEKLDQMPDDEVLGFLSQIKGVGVWTVEIFLMFGMGRTDLFPLDDLGLQMGIAGIFDLKDLNLRDLKKEMALISLRWSPHRTLAARYVWAWKDLQ